MYVCFGSLTDANARIWDVRFNSQSGRVRQLASMSAKCHKLTWSLAERQSHSCDEFAELTSRPRVARLCSNCHLVGNADQQQANADVLHSKFARQRWGGPKCQRYCLLSSAQRWYRYRARRSNRSVTQQLALSTPKKFAPNVMPLIEQERRLNPRHPRSGRLPTRRE
jgi:hypothetical protein